MPECAVLIADDEPLARERLRQLLRDTPSGVRYRVVGECSDGPATVAAIHRHRPALVFLDIQMPGADGVEVARAVRALEPPPTVVFVTAHREFALSAFEVHAADYLVKPVARDRFARMLHAIERRLDAAAEAGSRDAAARVDTPSGASAPVLPTPRTRFLVRSRAGLYFVHADEVESAAAEGNYIALRANGRSHLIRETMKSFAAAAGPAFVRIHRSAMVNAAHVTRLRSKGHGSYVITLRSGAQFTSSRSSRAALDGLLQG